MTIRKSPIMLSHRVVYLLLLVLQVMAQQQDPTTGRYGPQFKGNHVPAVVLGMLTFTLLFSVLACCICYKYTSTSPPGTSFDTEEGGRGGGGGGGPWTRRTSRGIEKDVIKSFPSFLYSQVKGLKIGNGGVECAICLNEFEDEETLRLMPPCSHAFHADCIDVWLSSRATCPVCRANLSIKLDGDQSFLYTNQDMDLEMGNAQRSALESPDVRLLNGVTWSSNSGENRTPRSRSTGSSNWRITEIFFPRSHSTGHSLVPIGENLDRFTLQLPEDVRRQLVSLSHTTLPQARSSRQGYRSGSVGSERRGFPYGRQYNRRTISLSFSFSFQTRSLQSSPGRGDLMALPKNLSRSVKSPFWKISEGNDKETGEGSFERLKPEMV